MRDCRRKAAELEGALASARAEAGGYARQADALARELAAHRTGRAAQDEGIRAKLAQLQARAHMGAGLQGKFSGPEA